MDEQQDLDKLLGPDQWEFKAPKKEFQRKEKAVSVADDQCILLHLQPTRIRLPAVWADRPAAG